MLAVKTEKYGGVKKFMAGLDKFADYKAICHAAGEVEQELGKVKGAIKELYINYDNLKTAIEMCQHLIGEHNFSADNLNELMALAEKLGEPASIIGALNTYGSIASLEAAKAGLEEQTKQRNQLLNKIDAEYQHAMKLSAELQAEIDQVTLLVNEEKKTITESPAVQKLLRLMNNPTEADFKEHAAVVLPILVAIRTWAASHTKQIGDLETLGMDPIIWALGG
jgi:chromosome segregation ATPase